MKKIVVIYNSIYEIQPDTDWINIYDYEQIGKFYFELEQFEFNFNNFFNILYENEINMFQEYDELEMKFNNLVNSCKEFLLYIQLKNDFMTNSTNICVNEDLYKIIKLDVLFDFIYKTIVNFDNLLIVQDPNIILLYLERLNEKYNTINFPLKKYFIIEIDDMIKNIHSNITSNNTNVKYLLYGEYDIIPYKDLLLFDGIFLPASFNFNSQILEMVELINQAKKMVLDNYYLNTDNNIFYKTFINYTYLNTTYNYININNTSIKSF
jgi:hypothetical protein